ncbi:hypothetical protein ES708_23531 [subsurface metagenome]
MKLGHNNFKGADLLHGMIIHRNTPAVILYADHISLFNNHGNGAAVSRKCFVDRIVDDLVSKVMETVRAGSSDIHTRPFTDMFHSLEYLDMLGAVAILHVIFPVLIKSNLQSRFSATDIS